jgi:hypothetical protein
MNLHDTKNIKADESYLGKIVKVKITFIKS